jgi:hypothetical protein
MYAWTERDNYTFEFVTENHDVFILRLTAKVDHFANFCSECKDIYGIDLRCLSGKAKPDYRVKQTIISILKQVLSDRCHSLVFFCDDEGGRADCREVLFERWYEDDVDADEKI